jgi:hypothetical protein
VFFERRYRELEQPIRRVGAVLESNDFHPARSGRERLGLAAALLTSDGPSLEDVYLEPTGGAAS